MRRPAAFLAVLTFLVLAGRHLLVRPPAWLDEDPLQNPFGLVPDVENSATGAEKPAETTRATPEDPVDIRRAGVEELTRLPGVGPVLARRIVALRDSLGTFVDAAQLQEVRGIGPKTVERLTPLIRLTPVSSDGDSTSASTKAVMD